MSDDRTFYGGEPPTGGAGGEIGRGVYEGAGIGAIGIWKCPSCRVENTGALEQGCASCGAGRPGFHVAPGFLVQAEAAARRGESPAFHALKRDREQSAELCSVAVQWVAAHADASLADAFIAGYQLARAQTAAHRMVAPPVTAAVAGLAPEGKARRTIIAALRLFKDQVLADTPEEIESGEWCSVEEAERLIAELEAQE